MGDDSLIDRALAAHAVPAPSHLGQQVQVTPEQALVHGVYLAVLDNRQGIPGADDGQIERLVQAARRAGIAEHEVEAAVAAGRRHDVG
jgi:hypothetical protein